MKIEQKYSFACMEDENWPNCQDRRLAGVVKQSLMSILHASLAK